MFAPWFICESTDSHKSRAFINGYSERLFTRPSVESHRIAFFLFLYLSLISHSSWRISSSTRAESRVADNTSLSRNRHTMSAVDYREPAVRVKIQFNWNTLSETEGDWGREATSRRKKIRIIRIAGSDKPVELRRDRG